MHEILEEVSEFITVAGADFGWKMPKRSDSKKTLAYRKYKLISTVWYSKYAGLWKAD